MTGRRILIIVIASIALVAGLAGVAGAVSQADRSAQRGGPGGSTAAHVLGDAPAPERPDDAGEAPVATASAEDAPDEGGLPPVPDDEPQKEPVEAPAEPASLVGGRVDGFPAFIPIIEGSRIVASAVTADGDRVQATLDAEAPEAPDEVLVLFRTAFAALAFAPVDTPSVGGRTAITFTDGADTVVVTVSESVTGGTDYSIFGILTAGREG
ncbi:hypothetical protein [Agromyces sp. PvR057]|uniref:hypothetical protein n=1 Tax=Agromyces sp. PvR057 TaxID=3156403 RepID=UPI003399E776